jgi:3-dehydrosphinganine reductase
MLSIQYERHLDMTDNKKDNKKNRKYSKSSSLQKHVIITGGGSGLGFGLATRYLKQGASVTILDLSITDEQQSTLAESAKNNHAGYLFLTTNITVAEEVKQSVNAAIEQYGPPDLAINSAGVLINKTLENTTPEAFKHIIDVNLNGSFNFASAVLPLMKSGSRIALIASVAGLISNYGYSAYGASKFGVVGLATTLRYEYEHRGINVSCVCPPEVKTPMVAVEHASGDPVSLELKKFAGSMQPDDACDQIFKGIEAGKWMIIPSMNAKSLILISRLFPRLFSVSMQQLIRYAVNKVNFSKA